MSQLDTRSVALLWNHYHQQQPIIIAGSEMKRLCDRNIRLISDSWLKRATGVFIHTPFVLEVLCPRMLDVLSNLPLSVNFYSI